jgi:hypothetical protein
MTWWHIFQNNKLHEIVTHHLRKKFGISSIRWVLNVISKVVVEQILEDVETPRGGSHTGKTER